MMEVVIKISEEDYQLMKDGHIPFNILDKMMNGIQLPKGHGRIIDESQVTGTFTWDNGYIECYAPTIIEADGK